MLNAQAVEAEQFLWNTVKVKVDWYEYYMVDESLVKISQ